MSETAVRHSPFPSDRGVAAWLFVCAAAVFAMVVIGGITRLTESGLSMVEWRPLYGFLPPLTLPEWERVFALYRQTPQFDHMFPEMTLSEFKSIFWWEYVHRLWGRLIGLFFAGPLVWFAIRRRIGKRLGVRLAVIFVLGGLQGLLGWYMVKSGLVDRPEVSQYRLTAHLGLALVTYALLIWTGLDLSPRPASGPSPAKSLAITLLVAVALTILAGGFMAGTDAGRAFTSYPLMDGRLWPGGYFALSPWYANLFENVTAINFNHRWLGTATALLGLVAWFKTRGQAGPVGRIAAFLLAVLALQFALGLATLLAAVPVALAAAHQAGAVLLLTVALWLTYETRGSGDGT
ncbi:MAG: COX15/CtaA family protein [Alphaproteobacteria bacterium]|nr:COX15/CtaA family protein [Alphaproteobacteria bacterium]